MTSEHGSSHPPLPQPDDLPGAVAPGVPAVVPSQEETVIEDAAADSPEDHRVAALMEEETLDLPELAEAVEDLEPADAADTLEELEDEAVVNVLGQMDDQVAADALAEMVLPLAVSVLEDLIDEDVGYAGLLMEFMAPDDGADLVQALPDAYRSRLLAAMRRDKAAKLENLLKYPKESAGGLMTTDFLAFTETMSVQQAVDFIRAHTVSMDTHHAFIIDSEGMLVGIVPLRKLLLARLTDRISNLMTRNVEAIKPELDREEVARTFDRYDYDMLPVVDEHRRLLGVVTVDDVIDIIRAEQTEDVQRMVGAAAGEAVYSPLLTKIRGRFPWLLVNLATSLLAAIVVFTFDAVIAELAILAVLMPVIANQAGNAGQQALAVTLRGIVLDEVRTGRVRPLLMREAATGAINGLIAGSALGLGITLVSHFVSGATWRLGVVAALSMSIALAVGCFVGAGIPLLMRKLKFDPAHGSSIFLTMTTDSLSFLTFLGTAHLLSQWLMH